MPADTDAPAALESLLGEMIATHERMLTVAREHRAALARADSRAIQDCISRQATLVQTAAELDQRRKALALAISPSTPATTILALAQKLPQPARALELASRLKQTLLTLQRENRILKTATEALLGHMDGLVQQVARALSQTRLYSPRGRIESPGPVPCGIDLTQ